MLQSPWFLGFVFSNLKHSGCHIKASRIFHNRRRKRLQIQVPAATSKTVSDLCGFAHGTICSKYSSLVKFIDLISKFFACLLKDFRIVTAFDEVIRLSLFSVRKMRTYLPFPV